MKNYFEMIFSRYALAAIALSCSGAVAVFPSPPSTHPSFHPSASALSRIPAGEFAMGDTSAVSRDALPAHRVRVSEFFIDRDEVSNDAMCRSLQWALDRGLVVVERDVVVGTRGTRPVLLSLAYEFRGIDFTNGAFRVVGDPSAPCILVAWHGALAHAAFRTMMENENGAGLAPAVSLDDFSCDFSATGYRLPTEAEWERAARNGLEGQHYPWPGAGPDFEEAIDPSRANYITAANPSGLGPRPIGSYPPRAGDPAGFGLNDMAGNVWEWCWDAYDARAYRAFPPDRWPADPTGPPDSDWEARVIRGGSWFTVAEHLRCANRGYMRPGDVTPYTGFRCARSAGPRAAAPAPVPPPPADHEAQVEADWRSADGLDDGRATPRDAAMRAIDLAERTLRLFPHPAAADRLTAVRKAADDTSPDWDDLYLRARRLRREAVLASPLLDFDRLLAIAGSPPDCLGNVTDQYLGRWSRAGDGLVTIENWKTRPVLRPLTRDRLPRGATQAADLSFDGRRVLFSFCDHTPPRTGRAYRLYESGVDGSGLRQLTGVGGRDPDLDSPGEVAIEDFDPCWLPGGGFVFMSTRCRSFGRCHGGRYAPSHVLHRAEADGSRIRRISFGESNQWNPFLLHDGTVGFTQWDYINRNEVVYSGLWSCRPDGANFSHLYGNYTYSPCMVAQARAVPDSPKIAAVASGHHSITCGSLILVDRRLGADGEKPLTRLTPDIAFPESEGWPSGNYTHPWPLSERLLLAAFTPDRVACNWEVARHNAYGLFLVDAAGGRELVMRLPGASLFQPIPLRPRDPPPEVPDGAGAGPAILVLQNAARHVPGVPPSEMKALRIVQLFEQPSAAAGERGAVEIELPKRIAGFVPLGADGSAAFTVPPDAALLFQIVDGEGRMRMGMRSQVYVRPGETRVCVGCHESNASGPGHDRAALRAPPLAPSPPAGPRYGGGFSFSRTVQPVLDRHCIRCHGLEKREGGLSLLGTPAARFSEAYDGLMARPGLVARAVRRFETAYSEPGDYGAIASRLPILLRGTHRDRVKLSDDGWRRLYDWMDLNAPFYGNYDVRRPEQDPPAAPAVAELRDAVHAACASCHPALADQPLAALANRTNPDESRVLLAPFAAATGGWGQCRGVTWATRDQDAWEKLNKAVRALDVVVP